MIKLLYQADWSSSSGSTYYTIQDFQDIGYNKQSGVKGVLGQPAGSRQPEFAAPYQSCGERRVRLFWLTSGPLGAVAYTMRLLTPPFRSSNLLSLRGFKAGSDC